MHFFFPCKRETDQPAAAQELQKRVPTELIFTERDLFPTVYSTINLLLPTLIHLLLHHHLLLLILSFSPFHLYFLLFLLLPHLPFLPSALFDL